MSNSSGTPRRIEILDSLRGIAALWVCWFHACIIFFPGSGERWWSGYGYLGVPIFYVISGFVIPYTLQQGGYSSRNFGRFFVKRTARLHPPFLASIAAVILVGAVANVLIRGANYHYGLKSIICNSLLVAPWFGEPWLLKGNWTQNLQLHDVVQGILHFQILPAHAVLGTAGLWQSGWGDIVMADIAVTHVPKEDSQRMRSAVLPSHVT
jgi:peptidoglycan/LPS O-acetylase OafA/YrhL